MLPESTIPVMKTVSLGEKGKSPSVSTFAESNKETRNMTICGFRRPDPRALFPDQVRRNQGTTKECFSSISNHSRSKATRKTELTANSTATQISAPSRTITSIDTTPKRSGGVPSRTSRNMHKSKGRQISNSNCPRASYSRTQTMNIGFTHLLPILTDEVPMVVLVPPETDDNMSAISLEGLGMLEYYDDRTLTPHPSYEIDYHDAKPNERDFHYLYQTSLQLHTSANHYILHQPDEQRTVESEEFHEHLRNFTNNENEDNNSVGIFGACWAICQDVSSFFGITTNGSDDVASTPTAKFTFLPTYRSLDLRIKSTPRDVMNLMRRGRDAKEKKKKPRRPEGPSWKDFSFNQNYVA